MAGQGGFNDAVKYHLTGMYQDWFLDYASYVILERAVPAIEEAPYSSCDEDGG